MKKFLVMSLFIFGFMNHVAAQEVKFEASVPRRLEIFQCVGLQRFTSGDVWLRFENFTDDLLKIRIFYVLPRGLEIKIRDDKKMVLA